MLPATGSPSGRVSSGVVPGRATSTTSATTISVPSAANERRTHSPDPTRRPVPVSRRASAAPAATPSSIGVNARNPKKPRPRRSASTAYPPSSRKPSTVGPSTPSQRSSNTAAKTTGATSIAQRERRAKPDPAPTRKPTAIAVSPCPAVIGPRGITRNASASAASAGIATAVAIRIGRRSHSGASAASGLFEA